MAGAYVVEQDDLVVVLEFRRDEPPHVLVTSKTVSKKQRLSALAGHSHVVSSKYICCHYGTTPGDRRDLRGSPPVAFYANAKLRFGRPGLFNAITRELRPIPAPDCASAYLRGMNIEATDELERFRVREMKVRESSRRREL